MKDTEPDPWIRYDKAAAAIGAPRLVLKRAIDAKRVAGRRNDDHELLVRVSDAIRWWTTSRRPANEHENKHGNTAAR